MPPTRTATFHPGRGGCQNIPTSCWHRLPVPPVRWLFVFSLVPCPVGNILCDDCSLVQKDDIMCGDCSSVQDDILCGDCSSVQDDSLCGDCNLVTGLPCVKIAAWLQHDIPLSRCRGGLLCVASALWWWGGRESRGYVMS